MCDPACGENFWVCSWGCGGSVTRTESHSVCSIDINRASCLHPQVTWGGGRIITCLSGRWEVPVDGPRGQECPRPNRSILLPTHDPSSKHTMVASAQGSQPTGVSSWLVCQQERKPKNVLGTVPIPVWTGRQEEEVSSRCLEWGLFSLALWRVGWACRPRSSSCSSSWHIHTFQFCLAFLRWEHTVPWVWNCMFF